MTSMSFKLKPSSDDNTFILTQLIEDSNYNFERDFSINLNNITDFHYSQNYTRLNKSTLTLKFEYVKLLHLRKIINKKCIRCKTNSETTYCKRCWKELY